MPFRATTLLVLLLVSAPAAGQRLGELGVSAGAGVSDDVPSSGRSVHSYGASGFASFEFGRQLDLELSYFMRMREGRSPSHMAGLTGRLSPVSDLELELGLFASPPGRSNEDVYCLPPPAPPGCVDAVERLGFLSPALGVGLTTRLGQDVVGQLEASTEATFYRLDYLLTSGRRAGESISIPLREYRFGVEASVLLFDRVGLGASGTYGLLQGAEEPGTERPSRLPPTELPVAPTRFEVGPNLSLDLTPRLRAELSAGFGPYIEPCFGHSALGSFRLTARPGRLRVYWQVTYQRDVSPTDLATLEQCDQEEPFPDYESSSARLGVSLEF